MEFDYNLAPSTIDVVPDSASESAILLLDGMPIGQFNQTGLKFIQKLFCSDNAPGLSVTLSNKDSSGSDKITLNTEISMHLNLQ